jgi:hypothetical protein
MGYSAVSLASVRGNCWGGGQVSRKMFNREMTQLGTGSALFLLLPSFPAWNTDMMAEFQQRLSYYLEQRDDTKTDP